MIAFRWRCYIAVCTNERVAYDKGKATDPIKYFAAKENQDLGVVKALRKPLPKLDLSPFPLPPADIRAVFLTYHRCIATVYENLGEKEQALDYYNQVLPLLSAESDRANKAVTLNNIGYVYSDLGDNQKALEYYNQALPLSHAVGDRLQEATTLNNIGTIYSESHKQKALVYYNQALPLLQAVGDRLLLERHFLS